MLIPTYCAKTEVLFLATEDSIEKEDPKKVEKEVMEIESQVEEEGTVIGFDFVLKLAVEGRECHRFRAG